MQRCLQLARLGEAGAPPNPMVGAVVVCDGKIIGEGFHRKFGGPHAEVNAIASVKNKELLCRSTIYVSLEPCAHQGKTPPCADLIIRCGIPRVVVGCSDPFALVDGLGIKKLRDAGREVIVGVLEQECRELNRRFFTFHQKHRPWITLKWAQSEDGYIGGKPDEAPVLLSSALTQTLMHRLRARSKAIMVGTRTALLDNPTLTTRLWPGDNPLRITIDRHSILPQAHHLLDGSTPSVIYREESLPQILSDLYSRGIQSLLVEGGRELLQSFIDAGLWDQARVETAPVRLGKGTLAPFLTNCKLLSEQQYGRHQIRNYCPVP